MNEQCEFKQGDLVAKRRGYKFPGEIRVVLWNRAGETRYVAECIAPDCRGMLHIFSGKDLRPMTEAEREIYDC